MAHRLTLRSLPPVMNTRLDFLPIDKDLTSASCATNSSNFRLQVKEKSSLSHTHFQGRFDTKIIIGISDNSVPWEFSYRACLICRIENGIFPVDYRACNSKEKLPLSLFLWCDQITSINSFCMLNSRTVTLNSYSFPTDAFSEPRDSSS